MSWYAYCLTEHQTLANGVRARRPFLLDGIQGVNGSPVMSYPSGEFAVIVSEYDRATCKLDEKSVLEHARVVSQSFGTATVLPFRFGTIFDTEDAIRQAVRSNRRTFCESVARLRGGDCPARYCRPRVPYQASREGLPGARTPDQSPGALGPGAQALQSARGRSQLQEGRCRRNVARYRSPYRHQVDRKISEPLQHRRQATQELPDGCDRSVAALSLPAREGPHRRRRQLESVLICPKTPFPEGVFLCRDSAFPSGRSGTQA